MLSLCTQGHRSINSHCPYIQGTEEMEFYFTAPICSVKAAYLVGASPLFTSESKGSGA